MPEEDALLENLDILLKRSQAAKFVDEAVEYTANTRRRESLVEQLTLLHNKIANQYSRMTHFFPLSNVVIRSYRDPYGDHNLVQIIENSDAFLTMPIMLQGAQGLKAIDSPSNRRLYYEEYEKRYELLIKAIGDGRLDQFLGYTPELLIHSILGFSGEFLPILRIDPYKGETYVAIKLMEPKPKPKTNEDSENPIITILKTLTDIKAKQAELKPVVTAMTKPVIAIGYNMNSRFGIGGVWLLKVHKEIMGIAEDVQGFLIISVNDGSPAYEVGLRGFNRQVIIDNYIHSVGGDVILEVDGKTFNSEKDFQERLDAEERISSLKLYRNGSTIEVQLQK